VSTFITRLETAGTGPRVAVKDLIDIEGVPTTAGSRVVARNARPAARDAACLAGARAADARLVGKTNLHELAMLPIGTNPWFGTPVNPLEAALIPGGSSSGSAVAVAMGEADTALGSDTGGSVRVPAACCGIAGLKTTHGRVSLDGVWPLAPSLDTVGPMATSIAGLVLGMELLEPGFTPRPAPARTIGRLRTAGHPEIEAAIDAALRAAEFEVITLDWAGFEAGTTYFAAVGLDEIWDVDHELVEANPDDVGSDVVALLSLVELFRAGQAEAKRQLSGWRESLFALFDQVELLALPTLPILPPRLDEVTDETMLSIALDLTRNVSMFNVAGTPCCAQPVPAAGLPLPASLQLVGPMGGEELLVSTAATVEAAAGWRIGDS
jgi:amidase